MGGGKIDLQIYNERQQSLVELLGRGTGIRPSAACPECGVELRRNLFRLQQFEDSFVEKEVDIRKRILKE